MTKSISADIEASWRSLVKDFRGSVTTTDGGTMWSAGTPTTSTGTSTTWKPIELPLTATTWKTIEELRTTEGTTTYSPWVPIPWLGGMPIGFTQEQRAMILDAICDQLIHPPTSWIKVEWTYPGEV